jgi:spore coat polysaccharide biosynthesis predicted glycosyltransferase SpsG
MRLPFDAIVIDSYALSNDWVTGAALRVPMALVDDWTRQRFDVPILVNANIGARATDYPLGRARRWLTGARAALLRREVVEARRRRPPGGPVDEVLVTLGGSDPHGVSAVIVADIRRTPWFREGGRLTVVLGASYRGPSLRSGPRLEVVRSPRDFMARCVAADLAVCGAATTTYELAFLGTPFVPVATVDNQERIATAWARQGVGFAISTASRRWRAVLRDAVTDATSRPETCQHTAARVQRLVDGRGAARLLSALRELLACSRGPSVQRGLVGH